MPAPLPAAPPQEGQLRVFVSNIERTLLDRDPQPGIDGIQGAYREKVDAISARAAVYAGYDVIILPSEPDPSYMDYLASLGRAPRVIVPKGLRPEKLNILDGFDDPEVRDVIRRGIVTPYMGSSAMYKAVEEIGGTYVGGDPGETVDEAGDKGNYAFIAEGIVSVPPGAKVRGVRAVMDAVLTRLHAGKGSFIRLTKAGGGLGNRRQNPVPKSKIPGADAMQRWLERDQPDLWEDGDALVEDILTLVHSPGVSFDTESGYKYSNLQITDGSDYIGLWSPIPPHIVAPERAKGIGNAFARKLGAIGFKGWGNTDLGVESNGNLVGFEINPRITAALHAVSFAEHISGLSWDQWGEGRFVIKSADSVKLKSKFSFDGLMEALEDAGLPMANLDNPFGLVVTIPPHEGQAGIQVHAKTYREAELLYRRMIKAVGKRGSNGEDHPLFSDDMRMAAAH